jgi:hypothetical protein
MANINLNKEIYNKTQFTRVVDNNFHQLLSSTPVTSSNDNQSVEAINNKITLFFNSYQDLFFDIPKFGDTNSHQYLVKQSGEYIGTINFPNDTVQALIEEINSLREQNLLLQQQLTSVPK